MKRQFKISAVLILFLSSMFCVGKAETVSQKQASQLAQLFFNEAAGRVVAPVKLVYNGRKLTTDRLFVPFYVYNNPAGGFVIISAENKAFPILGFSLKENFDPERLGEAENALLKSYAREIELVRYDSSVPYMAIEAWEAYPDYVHKLLGSVYYATDPVWPIQDVYENLYLSLEPGHNPSFSDIYTPEQWQDMTNEELLRNPNVALGLIENNSIVPVIVHGRKGDYYRMELSRRNDWLMRLNATELISADMIGLFNNPIPQVEDAVEELPFELIDNFIAEVNEIESERTSTPSPDLFLISDKPALRSHGGGRFEIILPENVSMATVYNLAGAIVNQRTFNDSNSAFIDISGDPGGFYLVRVIGESGTPYGMKLYR